MNDDKPMQLIEDSARRMVAEVKDFARREPGTVVAGAFGAALLINLVPTRMVSGTVAQVATSLLRPVLISLGLFKVLELCCVKTQPSLRP